jgi:hypothetical protein
MRLECASIEIGPSPALDIKDGVPGRKLGWKRSDMGGLLDNWPFRRKTDIQAIGRLTPRESYDRAFRMRTAFQQSVLHRELPKKQWTTTEQASFPNPTFFRK